MLRPHAKVSSKLVVRFLRKKGRDAEGHSFIIILILLRNLIGKKESIKIDLVFQSRTFIFT